MWTDNETDKDYINFESVSKTVAEIICKADNEPVSIGVSGSWGVGKSSLIKLVNKSLREKVEKTGQKYIYVEFNAWLYQGYDDARAALMESIATKLIEEAEKAKEGQPVLDKARSLLKRVNWLRVTQFTAKNAIPMALGLPPAGIVGDIVTGAKALLDGSIEQKDLDGAFESAAKATKKAQGFLNEEEQKSPPKEIQALRDDFKETLESLGATLIVLIDDLDRCLPDTTISTLEAIRLFLFLPNTAFVIAADRKMIRHAVKKHFSGIDDELVTNYFDKLIQVPIQVPPLGTQEVRGYMMLLFVENSDLSSDQKLEIVKAVNAQLKETWKGKRVDRTFMAELNGIKGNSPLISKLDLVERLAPIMTTAKSIKGNPRLIKRFLNALSIRQSIASANSITVNEEALAKMLLFERCGDTKCYDELLKGIVESGDGKVGFIKEWEEQISKGEKTELDEAWKGEFESNWLSIPPYLGDIDLRGIIYVSREYAPIISSEEQLSSEASEILVALLENPGTANTLRVKIDGLVKAEVEIIMTKLLGKAESIQSWGVPDVLTDLICLASVDHGQGERLKAFLKERPINQITAAIIPKINSLPWARELYSYWYESGNETIKKAAMMYLGEK